MINFFENQSEKSGLPPGSLVYVGEEKTEKVRTILTNYNKSEYQEKEVENEDACCMKQADTITWIHFMGLHEPNIIESVGCHYQIHHLILEDILNTMQRPKLEDYEDSLFIVLKIFYHDNDSENIFVEQCSMVLGEDFVISFQEGHQDIFEPVRKRLRNNRTRIRKMGSDYLAYALMDTLIDHYFAVIETIDDRIESVEEELFTELSQDVLQDIHQLKQDTISLRKAILPIRGLISNLERSDSPLIHDTTRVYLRDLHDHIIQIADTVETFREITTGLLDIYHSGISNKMNEVMKVLTIIATIFIPLTFIAGIYGMNFKYMPELEWQWGYPLIWIIIILIALFLLIFFKKKKWL